MTRATEAVEKHINDVKNLRKTENFRKALLSAGDAYDAAEERLGRYHPTTIERLIEMGEILALLDEFVAATDTLVESRARINASLYPAHPLMLRWHRAMADLYRRQDRTGEAAGFRQLALTFAVEHEMLDEQYALDVLSLSEEVLDEGDVEKAQALLDHISAFSSNGPELPEAVQRQILRQQASVYVAAGDAEASLESFEELLSRLTGRDLIEPLQALSELYQELDMAGPRADCLRQLAELAYVYEANDHRRYVVLLTEQGDVLFDLGDPGGAIEAYRKALKQVTELPSKFELGERMVLTFRIAEALLAGDRPAEAETLLQDLLSSGEPGHDAALLAEALHWQGLAALRQDRFEEAKESLERSHELRSTLFGPQHSDTFASKFALCVLAHQRNADDELPELLELEEAAGRSLGSDHPLVVEIQNFREDLELARRAILEETTIHETPVTPPPEFLGRDVSNVSDLFGVAVLNMSNRNFQVAMQLLERTLQIMEQKAGPESPELVPILMQLAEANAALGRNQEADLLRERARRIPA